MEQTNTPQTPTNLPSEKIEQAIDALVSYFDEEDNYFTRAASEQSVMDFVHTVQDFEPEAFGDILTGNISLLNTAFQKNMLGAIRPKNRSDSLADAVRTQNQIVRSVDAWRRLKDFENRQTK